MDTNKTHPAIKKILDYDIKLTKSLVSFLLNFIAFRSVKNNCRLLEISCHGIAWLASWMAFCWLINSPSLYNMQINMLLGLIIDIIIVAVIKAATRRRRPTADVESIGFGPDKFSFPSGHASRAFFVVGFFTVLYPLPVFMWPALIVWALSVSVSRLLMYRHHLLDVCAGMLLGIFETLILYVVWLGPELTKSIMLSLSEDYVPGGPE